VALRRELHAVYVELFGTGGAELVLRTPSEYALDGRAVTFAEVQAAAAADAEIALGVRRHDGVTLAPARDDRWTFVEGDRIVAVTRVEEERRSRAD
jgi:hypothetical protein